MHTTLLSISEASEYLGFKKSYLHKLMMRKEIPYYKPNGKHCYFDKDDLDKWLRRIRIPSQDEIDEQAVTYITRRRILGK
jgi:excisionase family DNA binding protein